MHRIISDEALDALFRAARSHYAWLARPVSETLLRAVWQLAKLGPVGTAAGPAQIVFVQSDRAKERLGEAVPPPGRAAITSAPAAAILGSPIRHDQPAAGLRHAGPPAAYLIVAARALGLDCGPVWDFDRDIVDGAFFPDRGVAANFICALGYGDGAQLSAHEPVPGFDEACTIL